jgi:hypothetical protein
METVRIRDGKKSDPGSGINIPYPQHCGKHIWAVQNVRTWWRCRAPATRPARPDSPSPRRTATSPGCRARSSTGTLSAGTSSQSLRKTTFISPALLYKGPANANYCYLKGNSNENRGGLKLV